MDGPEAGTWVALLVPGHVAKIENLKARGQLQGLAAALISLLLPFIDMACQIKLCNGALDVWRLQW